MAVYPTQFLWDVSSQLAQADGENTIQMMDGSRHTQTFYRQGAYTIEVTHRFLSSAELDTIKAFFSDNAGVDFDLVEPLSGVSYVGHKSGPLRTSYDGDGTSFRTSWAFVGEIK